MQLPGRVPLVPLLTAWLALCAATGWAQPVGKDPVAAAPPPTDKSVPARGPQLLGPGFDEVGLEEVWKKWQAALAAQDFEASGRWRAELLKLRSRLGPVDLELYAGGMMRAAEEASRKRENGLAVDSALAAVSLAPELAAAHFTLAEVYFRADAWAVGRWSGALSRGLSTGARDPRVLRPLLADLGAAALVALLAAAMAALFVYLLRSGRYFAHDVHRLLPSSASRLLSGLLALVLLAAPFFLRFGLFPSLLLLLAALTLYLSWNERLLLGVLLGVVALAPTLAAIVLEWGSFERPALVRHQRLQQGGGASQRASAELARLADQGQLEYADLLSLGTYELAYGRADAAVSRFKSALTLRPGDATAMVQLANAMFAKGDFDGAKEVYEGALRADANRVDANFNLGKLLELRPFASAEEGASAKDRGLGLLAAARQLDPSLSQRVEPDAPYAMQVLLVPGVPMADLLAGTPVVGQREKLRKQLERHLYGEQLSRYGVVYAFLLVPLVLGLGLLQKKLGASRGCTKCGRAVCRRCNPELLRSSQLCGQCANVFAAKNVTVPPALVVQKQVEVARYQVRREKAAYALGILCSGAGHLFVGRPLRGLVYAFLFLFFAASFVFRFGILRAPVPLSPLLKLLPLGALFLVAYALSLRGLYKSQPR